MSRTSVTIPLGRKSVDDVLNIFTQVMTANKYANKIINGEDVWSKGDGVLAFRQCFALSFSDQSVLLQGWVTDAMVGESGLTGFAGMVPKRKMKKLMDEIVARIQF